jgi:hypothetical protein
MPKFKPAKPSTRDAWAPTGECKPARVSASRQRRRFAGHQVESMQSRRWAGNENENESRQTRGINTKQLQRVRALPVALVCR